MKRCLALALALLMLLLSAVPVSALDVSAAAAALVCAETGQVLFEKNADRRLPMASTTKMMTALLAVEACTPAREIRVTSEMANAEGTSMGLQAGDVVTLRALVAGMLLASGNDAANAAAIALGGSLAGFAEMMNARARSLGLRDTQFVTPSGLDDPAHYSTAHDLARLACACLRNPEFAAVCKSRTMRVSFGNPPVPHTLTNHNRLLWRDESVIGVKTGFTKRSGRCLVSAAVRNGLTFVAVTLNAPDDWEDHLALFDYAETVCKPVRLTYDADGAAVRVFGGVRPRVQLALADAPAYPADGAGYACALLLRPYCFAPVQKGAVLGTAVFSSGGRCIARVPVVAAEAVERRSGAQTQEQQRGSSRSGLLQRIHAFFNRGESRGSNTDAAAEVSF